VTDKKEDERKPITSLNPRDKLKKIKMKPKAPNARTILGNQTKIDPKT